MAPEALPPNPVPSRAISNDISLLLASKSNRLRGSALFRNLSSSSRKPSPHSNPAQEDSAFTTGGQNSGVGFTPSSGSAKDKASDAATATLRSKLLGKKRKGRAGDDVSGRGRAGQESEEDEDEGRSGLGRKKKKVKKQRRDEEEEPPQDTPKSDEQEEEGEDGGGEGVPRAASTAAEDDTGAQPNPTTKAKRKKKNKARAKNME